MTGESDNVYTQRQEPRAHTVKARRKPCKQHGYRGYMGDGQNSPALVPVSDLMFGEHMPAVFADRYLREKATMQVKLTTTYYNAEGRAYKITGCTAGRTA